MAAILPTVPFEKVIAIFLSIFSAGIILARLRRGVYVLIFLFGIGNALSAEYPSFLCAKAMHFQQGCSGCYHFNS